MAKYSPGFPVIYSDGALIIHPFALKSSNFISQGLQPVVNDFLFSENRFGINNASGDFSSLSELVQYPVSSVFEIQEFTISAWVNSQVDLPSGNRAIAGVLSNLTFPNNLSFGLLIADNVPGVVVNDSEGLKFAFSFAPVDVDAWNHYAAVLNSGLLTFYFNGLLRQQVAVVGGISFNDASFVIGQTNQGDLSAGSLISDVFLSDVPYSISEIQQIVASSFFFKGSREGSVFQQSGKSFAIRTRRKPVFKRTEITSKSRSDFHAVQSSYRNLSSGEKSSWVGGRVANSRINSLGQEYLMSASNLFNAFNKPFIPVSPVLKNEYTGVTTIPGITGISTDFDLGTEELRITLTPSGPPSGFVWQLFFSPLLYSVGEIDDVSRVVRLLTLENPQDIPANLWSLYVGQFGSIDDLIGRSMTFVLRAIAEGDRNSREILRLGLVLTP